FLSFFSFSPCFEFPFSFLFSGKKSYYSSVSPVKPEQNDKNLTESLQAVYANAVLFDAYRNCY
ncbi:MAG: hypothetical protein ACTSWF_08190, partial [Candidatus Freyarchaeota archaeon]